MGRWDNDSSGVGVGVGGGDGGRGRGFGGSGAGSGGGTPKKKRNVLKLVRRIIYIGFIIVAIVVTTVFVTTAGLHLEIIQRGGDVQTISVKLSNNNFYGINNVTIQFDDNETQTIGNMGPFSSVYLTPDKGDVDFHKVVVTANNGELESIKTR